MSFPAKLLAADEEIELDLHPHWKALAAPAAALVAACGAAGFAMAMVPEGESAWLRWALAALALAAIARWAVFPWLTWLSTRYVITSERLIVRSGFLVRDGRDLPLVRVDDVSFSQGSLVERLLGCGTLVVESAGRSRGRMVLSGLPHVEETQRDLHRLVARTAARSAARRAGPGPVV